MLGLAIYESGICECGHHSSLTHNLENVFTFEDDRCPVCAGVARYARLRAKQDEAADKALGENPAPHMARAADGRRTFVRQMSPLEVAERRESRGQPPILREAVSRGGQE